MICSFLGPYSRWISVVNSIRGMGLFSIDPIHLDPPPKVILKHIALNVGHDKSRYVVHKLMNCGLWQM